MARYAEVIVPLPLPTLFTYIIPEELQDIVKPMFRVVVPFGSRKYYTGIVTNVTDHFGGEYDLKEILMTPDKQPIARHPQIKLWEWIADYYMCAIGDVYKAAIPSGLKIESETIVEINDGFEISQDFHLTPKMSSVYEFIKKNESVSLKLLEKEGIKNVMSAIYPLLDMGAVTIREKITERIRPKTEEFLNITINREDADELSKIFESLRSPRYERLLLKLIHLSEYSRLGMPLKEIPLTLIKDDENYDRAIIKSFEKKGFIRIEKREVSGFAWNRETLKPLPVLSEDQQNALDAIHSKFLEKSAVLLHGVTSSGKTEIYIHLIDFALKQNKQALYLVPEIALTTQLTRRLQDVFGSKVIIYHSRFSDLERVKVWRSMLSDHEPRVIIGARSSLFLPFASLGLVIVDEEHEQSYKQADPAPRYNGRDLALVLAGMHGAKTLLASATPSVETYHKALEGRYGLVTLDKRYGDVKMPAINIVDMVRSKAKGEVNGALSATTISHTREAVNNGNQVIIFHNRRGFSPIARCKSCEYIPRCTDCDVSLSYHKRIDRLVCHYCGKEYALPSTCPVCQSPTVEVVGFGTERIEDEIEEIFNDAKVLRMDLDTTRNKDNYSRIIDTFSSHKADILIGTQMVTKGLDFGKVSTVAVLNADMLFNYPDFRATERAFNMLEQVSGRAGRRNSIAGNVMIQTRQPDHPVIDFVVRHDYNAFYEYEIEERRKFAYPPFVRLIYIFVRHKDEKVCNVAAQTLYKSLNTCLGNRVFGPHQPAVSRVKTLYIRRLMVKIEPTVSLVQIKTILSDAVKSLKTITEFRNVDIYFDVDPV